MMMTRARRSANFGSNLGLLAKLDKTPPTHNGRPLQLASVTKTIGRNPMARESPHEASTQRVVCRISSLRIASHRISRSTSATSAPFRLFGSRQMCVFAGATLISCNRSDLMQIHPFAPSDPRLVTSILFGIFSRQRRPPVLAEGN